MDQLRQRVQAEKSRPIGRTLTALEEALRRKPICLSEYLPGCILQNGERLFAEDQDFSFFSTKERMKHAKKHGQEVNRSTGNFLFQNAVDMETRANDHIRSQISSENPAAFITDTRFSLGQDSVLRYDRASNVLSSAYLCGILRTFLVPGALARKDGKPSDPDMFWRRLAEEDGRQSRET